MGEDLGAHERLRDSNFVVKVLPSLRDAVGIEAEAFDRFSSLGCRLADHAVGTAEELEAILPQAREYARRGWILQLHLGAQRQTSSRLRRLSGPAGGYASIGNSFDIPALCRFLDGLERDDSLPRVILFPLNPADYIPLATLTGSFAEDGVAGKIQLGPAWWFNDHELGIRAQLDALAAYGTLSTFIGMTTDSRSLLSMVRHDYFRRILCTWINERVEAHSFPDDAGLLESLVRDLCYHNAAGYLNL
ncbi:MAG: glucuronate isomerase [Blastochloris sp.]|nr:glucuronate isomerase [Blastochloris sp.]